MENKITKIQVLGTGCPTCKQLFEAVKKIATELKKTSAENVAPKKLARIKSRSAPNIFC